MPAEIATGPDHKEKKKKGMKLLLFASLISPLAAFQLSGAASLTRSNSAAVSRSCSFPVVMEEADAAPVTDAAVLPAAYIEFIIGVPEPCVPDVSLTRSRDGATGVATFTFDNPSFLSAASEALGETTGMYLKDSEGTLKTSEVTATFTNGRPRFVKGVVVMKGTDEWDRFMRFMERCARKPTLVTHPRILPPLRRENPADMSLLVPLSALQMRSPTASDSPRRKARPQIPHGPRSHVLGIFVQSFACMPYFSVSHISSLCAALYRFIPRLHVVHGIVCSVRSRKDSKQYTQYFYFHLTPTAPQRSKSRALRSDPCPVRRVFCPALSI